MSGFFDKTREDMQYIFKKRSTLSQSEKKHKLRAWATVIGIALVVVQLVFTVLTLLKLYKLDILPLKYIAKILTPFLYLWQYTTFYHSLLRRIL